MSRALMSEDNSVVEGNDNSTMLDDNNEEEYIKIAGEADHESDGSSHLTASDDVTSWIRCFVTMRGHDFFCEIDEDFIQDDFNLTGLHSLVPYYNYALDCILDVDIPSGATRSSRVVTVDIRNSEAKVTGV